MKIVVLQHEYARRNSINRFDIGHMAEVWRRDGHEVVEVFGVNRFVGADVCIVHVDLSVVPEEYLDYASKYDASVNANVNDIRKRTFSDNLLARGDNYDGKVIVKSDENYAGWPEFAIQHNLFTQIFFRIASKYRLTTSRFYSPIEYAVFDNIRMVPDRYFVDPYFVVEKFLPQFEDGIYYVNMDLFLGDHHEFYRLGSRNPVVKGESVIIREEIESNQEVVQMQSRFDIDFGKFDYCMHQGKVVLLDVNKIVGFGGFVDNEIISFDERARALYKLVDSRSSA